MADELIDIVDENNNLIGEQKMRSEAHRDGLWHRAAHIWIYNSSGEVLLQLRSKEKVLYPDVWDLSAAGHIPAGEEPITAALREIQEEIGLDLKPGDLEFYRVIQEKIEFDNLLNNEFHYVYLFQYNGDANQLRVQEEEVQKIQFIPVEEVRKGVENNPEEYVPHYKEYWTEMLTAIEDRTKK